MSKLNDLFVGFGKEISEKLNEDKFIIIINDGGSYGGGDVFNMEELIGVMKEWSDYEDMVDEDDNVISIDDLIDSDGVLEICNECMCERGDDSVGINIIKLNL